MVGGFKLEYIVPKKAGGPFAGGRLSLSLRRGAPRRLERTPTHGLASQLRATLRVWSTPESRPLGLVIDGTALTGPLAALERALAVLGQGWGGMVSLGEAGPAISEAVEAVLAAHPLPRSLSTNSVLGSRLDLLLKDAAGFTRHHQLRGTDLPEIPPVTPELVDATLANLARWRTLFPAGRALPELSVDPLVRAGRDQAGQRELHDRAA